MLLKITFTDEYKKEERKEFLWCCRDCGEIVESEELIPLPDRWAIIKEGAFEYCLCPKCREV